MTRNEDCELTITTKAVVSVKCAQHGSPELLAVRTLWRQHSDTLGFFPEGAFAQYAKCGCILIAVDSNQKVVGYLLYRTARGMAVVVHLCCDEARRGQGIARQLFIAFRDRTSDLIGARLTCRTDFGAASIWSRLGFVQIEERVARESTKVLGIWALDYGHPDLFSAHAAEMSIAVMDANVFFDLTAPVDTPTRSIEAQALRADWLVSSFLLAVTPELTTEIGRNKLAPERKRLRHLASTFHRVRARPKDVDEAVLAVTTILGPAISPSEHSDRRQIGFAIASKADVFLTRDGELLDRAETFQELFGLRVLRPVDLINDIDANDQPWAYRPARLDGSGLSVRQVRTEDFSNIKAAFLYFGQQETIATLPLILRQAIAQPRTCTTKLVSDNSDTLLALLCTNRSENTRLRIRLLRVCRRGLSATLARHLLWNTIQEAVRSDASVVTFEDPFTDETIRQALIAVGFVRDDTQWIKVIVRGILSATSARLRLSDNHDRWANIPTAVQVALNTVLQNTVHPADVARVEHILWPLKLRTDVLPCYLVPIRPAYAEALFETAIAAESLFELNSELLLRLENVYYRAPRFSLSVPARIIWYVSDEKGYSRAKHACAASALTRSTVGPAKEIFTMFRRFGIYRYADLRRIAAGNKRGNVMALTFAQTEVFRTPVPLPVVQQVLRSHTGNTHPLAGPVRLPVEAWCDLYELGAKSVA